MITIIWMLYAWENPDHENIYKSPKNYASPKLSFTTLIPARHEDKVIKDTIKAVNAINYPNRLKEIIVLCKSDDKKTIEKVEEIQNEIKKGNIRLVKFDSEPINKPHSLNVGMAYAKK